MTRYSVRDEYSARYGRQELTIWSGGFASDFEGWATELPNHDGYMVRLDYFDGKTRVSCESPRTEDNYERVDNALEAAATGLAVARAQAVTR